MMKKEAKCKEDLKKCEKQNETKECQMGNVENEAKICYVCSSRGLGFRV